MSSLCHKIRLNLSQLCAALASGALLSFPNTAIAEQEDYQWESDAYEDSLIPLSADFLDDDSMVAMESSDQPSAPKNHERFASARPTLSKGWGIVLFGDFIYWKAKEEGLYYALPSPNFTNAPPLAQNDPFKGVNGKIARLSPEYEPGFRVGAEIDLPRDDWDVAFNWTSYHNSHHSSAKAKGAQVVFPFWANPNFDPIAMEAEAHWDLHFHELDLTLGRSVYVGRLLSLRPYAGFQAAWIEQDFNLDYETITFRTGATTPFLKVNNHNNSQGYGLTMGMDSKWELDWGFYIEGDFAASLLWTDFDIGQFEKNADRTPRSKIKDGFSLVTATLDFFGGLAWERHFHSDRFYFEIHVGWEEQVWFNQNQLNRVIDNINLGEVKNEQGNLSFSGWTIGAKIGF